MKKLLVFMLVLSNYISSALANPYIKLSGGVSKMNDLKINESEYNELGYMYINMKLKSKATGFGEIGVGYQLLDNFRADLTLAYFFTPEHKGSTGGTIYYYGNPVKTHISIDTEASINTFMVNGYVDLFKSETITPFVGAGIGLAQVKQKAVNKVTATYNLTAVEENSTSTKRSNNFSYSVTAGASVLLSDRASLEFAYSYRDFGKTKPTKDIDGTYNVPKMHYKGHHLALGVRFVI